MAWTGRQDTRAMVEYDEITSALLRGPIILKAPQDTRELEGNDQGASLTTPADHVLRRLCPHSPLREAGQVEQAYICGLNLGMERHIVDPLQLDWQAAIG